MEPVIDAGPSTPGPQDPLLELVYRVGAVARLANIPVETLRVWERRYGIVEHQGQPHRHRFYSLRDVHRLTLIKKLVDLGSSISSIARLSQAELQQMYLHATDFSRDGQPAIKSPATKHRLILIGPALRARFAAADTGLRPFDVVEQGDTLEAAGDGAVPADVLVIEIDTLEPEMAIHLDRVLAAVQARIAIVAYRFAATDVVEEFALRGHVMQRAPLRIETLDSLCAVLPAVRDAATRLEAAEASAPPAPAARFDERTLARIATMSTDLQCECPRHVTELLLSLSAFEKYSAQCASRSPEDSELHLQLGRVAAHCRRQFEDALIYMARVEGIPLT